MAHHLIAFFGDNLGSGANTFSQVDALHDQSVQVTPGNRVILSRDMSIIAGFAGSSDPTRAMISARVVAPSLRKIVSPSITPTIQQFPAKDNPPMMVVADWPWKVCAQEEIGVEANFNGSSVSAVALLWLEDKRENVPQGENFWLRGTVSALASAGPKTSSWTGATITFDQTLAAGRYAVIGFVLKGNDTIAARLIFDDQMWRPGTLAIPPIAFGGQRTHDAFYDGSLGVFGRFESYSPPRLELLRQTSASDNDHEVYLRVVRLNGANSDMGSSVSSGVSKANYG